MTTGCMYCGKTQDLLRRIDLEEHAERAIQVFNHTNDDRYGPGMWTHDKKAGYEGAIMVSTAEEIAKKIKSDTQFVAINEVQFFDEKVLYLIEELALKGINVSCAALDTDFRGELFRFKDSERTIGDLIELVLGTRGELMHPPAVCKNRKTDTARVCGAPATRTQRFTEEKPSHYREEVVVPGGKERYGARCYDHHIVPGRPTSNFSD